MITAKWANMTCKKYCSEQILVVFSPHSSQPHSSHFLPCFLSHKHRKHTFVHTVAHAYTHSLKYRQDSSNNIKAYSMLSKEYDISSLQSKKKLYTFLIIKI